MVRKYTVKVTLNNFEKLITRKFEINDNVKIDDFCKAIIVSMNGDLSHLYQLKYKNKRYVCSYMDAEGPDELKMRSLRISTLLVDKNDKLDLWYDFGDDWHFKITISKIEEGHNPKNIVLIDGKGKGIEEDCGGSWGLEELIENPDNDWEYDISDFSIDEINEYLDKCYNERKKNNE